MVIYLYIMVNHIIEACIGYEAGEEREREKTSMGKNKHENQIYS